MKSYFLSNKELLIYCRAMPETLLLKDIVLD